MSSDKNTDELAGAETWKAAAIAVAVITPCACAFTLPWVFAAQSDQDMLYRVQIVGAVVAFGVTLVTFCTVVWRGMISAQQARLQRIQIDRLAEQIAETAKANSAELLQKGAELLAETDKPAYVSAGIATLGSVARDAKDRFAAQAMTLLSEYVQESGEASHAKAKVRGAIGILDAAWRETGNRADFSFRFVATENRRTIWQLIFWATRVSYVGGTINAEDFTDIMLDEDQPRMVFQDVTFNRCKIYRGPETTFSRCTFQSCQIIEMSVLALQRNSFERCDFSSATVTGVFGPVPDLRAGGNWFARDTPPRRPQRRRAQDPFDWTSVLLDERPIRQLPRMIISAEE